MNKASLYIHVQVFYGHLFAFLLSKCLGVNSIGVMVGMYVIFEEQFSKMFVQLCMRVPLDPHPCQHSVMSGILISAITMIYNVNSLWFSFELL